MTAYPTDILWVHGESDSVDLADANAYAANFATWKAETRAKVGAGCRIHVADLSPLPGGYPYWEIVQAAIRAGQAGDPLATIVETADLAKIADGVHYTGGAIRRLGYRAALAIAGAM